MKVLGISAYYHDSAAALVEHSNGASRIIAAAQEERFTRKKFDPDFPIQSINFCLKQAGISFSEIDSVVFYDKPWITFERLLETYLTYSPRGLPSFLMSMPKWLTSKLNLRGTLQKEFKKHFDRPAKELLFSSHHLSHAASAFFASPYEEAAVLCMDGVGEWATTSVWFGKGNSLSPLWEIQFPHSLGLLYSAFTYFCGFKVNSGEYKLMGLAPYGESKYYDLIKKELIDIKEDGTFRLNLDFFAYTYGLKMTSRHFEKLFGIKPRAPEEKIREIDLDLAASIQLVTEEIVLRLARTIKKETGSNFLCMAGGVALNCVANGKLISEKIFEKIWVQPAAGDSGGALGAALGAIHLHYGQPRSNNHLDLMHGGFLGPSYNKEIIEAALSASGIKAHVSENRQQALTALVDDLSSEKVVGCFQGRMEYGPRALGHRSILGDPRSNKMQSVMNLKIKFREGFRPFAPAILTEQCNSIFELNQESPYMLLVAPIKKELRLDSSSKSGLDKVKDAHSIYPSITHVDYSARIQTVSEVENPEFYEILKLFNKKTGCPLLVNTSFNIRGEPIVNTPEDAIRCFLNTHMDSLLIENYYIRKEDLTNHTIDEKWRAQFELD